MYYKFFWYPNVNLIFFGIIILSFLKLGGLWGAIFDERAIQNYLILKMRIKLI